MRLMNAVSFTRGGTVLRRSVAPLAVAGLLLASAACPITRPSIPPEFYDFRAQLQGAVTDTAVVELEGLSGMQAQLEDRLADLAAILTVDSLLADLGADPALNPLAGSVATTVRIQLESKDVSGGVRDAFQTPSGQRQAVDAIVIGLGRALRVLGASAETRRGELARWTARPRERLARSGVGHAQYRVQIDGPHGEQPLDSVSDFVVGSRGASRQADLDLAIG